MNARLVPLMVRCECLSNMDSGCVPPMVICECWECLSEMVLDVFLSWSNVSVGWAILTWCQM